MLEQEQLLHSAILLADCPDRRGIIAAISDLLHADQHQDNESGTFFMRIEWWVEGCNLEEEQFRESFALSPGSSKCSGGSSGQENG